MARFTQEEYEIAKNTSLLDYLQQNGYRVKQKGREFCLEEHDSLMINPEKNTWFWWSRNIGGSVIQFLEIYEDKTLIEAVNILNNKPAYMNTRKYSNYEIVTKNEKGKLVLPPKNENTKRVFAYLSQTRKIDSEIINSMIENELIYESSDKHEIVFLGRDRENEVKFACKRATLTNSSFKQDVQNSSKEYGFKLLGKSSRVFVFESNIDLLSHCTLTKMQGLDWKKDNRLSLGGVSDRSLGKFLEENENIEEIILFLDNDETGLENSKKIAEKYGFDYKVSIFSPKQKDLNETLIKIKENPNLDIRSCIQKIDNRKNCYPNISIPFKCPEVGDNEELYQNLLKETSISKNKILEMFKDGVIYQDVDRNMIFLTKDEQNNVTGGYSLDIYNQEKSIKLLENSDISEKQSIEMKNFISYIYQDLENLEKSEIEIDELER